MFVKAKQMKFKNISRETRHVTNALEPYADSVDPDMSAQSQNLSRYYIGCNICVCS